ncbi:hypothetical protein D3C87_183680 [compost metagenome]
MKNIFNVFIVIICFSSCKTDKIKLEGDLYFKLIDLPQFFAAPDSILAKIESGINPFNNRTVAMQKRKDNELLQFMVKRKLLRKAFIRLRQDNGEVKLVFLNPADYENIRYYNQDELLNDGKKIRLSLEVAELRSDSMHAYEVLRLISIKKVEGITYWKK